LLYFYFENLDLEMASFCKEPVPCSVSRSHYIGCRLLMFLRSRLRVIGLYALLVEIWIGGDKQALKNWDPD